MKSNNQNIFLKELKIILSCKKIILYFLIGPLFPIIMRLVLTYKFEPILPLIFVMPFCVFYVAMLGSEFLYISLAEEIKFNTLDIMLISPFSKNKIIISKSMIPFFVTLFIVFASIFLHDITSNILNIKDSFSLLSLSNIIIVLVAITCSILGEWLCLLSVKNYSNDSHTKGMIISTVIMIGLFYLMNKFSLTVFIVISIIVIILEVMLVLKLLSIKSKHTVLKLYFQSCFNKKKLSKTYCLILRELSEFRNIKRPIMKLVLTSFLLLIYYILPFVKKDIPFSLFIFWGLLYMPCSYFINTILFPTVAYDHIYKMNQIYRVAKINEYYIAVIKIIVTFVLTIIMTLFMFIALLIIGTYTSLLLPNIIYYTTILSIVLLIIFGYFMAKLVNNYKEFKVVFTVYSIISLCIHMSIYFIFI